MIIKINKVNIDKMVDILLNVKGEGNEYASIIIEENVDNHTIHINPAPEDPGEVFNPELSI